MKFYNRENELALLERIKERASTEAQMTMIVGRRRIGKTCLLKKAMEHDTESVYLFVSRKSEQLLCQEFKEEIERVFHVTIFGIVNRFRDLFAYLMELSSSRSITVIIDEFQEFQTTNPSVYSDIQNIWDSKKTAGKMNLILCGSVYSMMTRIFENSGEPLFARVTERIHVRSFPVSTLKEILEDHNPSWTSEDFLALYAITGGVAKYVDQLAGKGALTFSTIMDEIFRENALFLDEGKNVLIEEFGKEYATYFSILSLIASGKTSRPEIESILEGSIGGYLDRLEHDFNIVEKVRPAFSKPGGRTIKYVITDHFLRFWFRFIYKYQSAVEIGNYAFLRSIVDRDYKTFSGKVLERYFVEKLAAEKRYSFIGTYWEKDNKNEIDIVAVNDLNKTMLLAEIKRKKENINLGTLKEKSMALKDKFSDYTIELRGFSMEDM